MASTVSIVLLLAGGCARSSAPTVASTAAEDAEPELPEVPGDVTSVDGYIEHLKGGRFSGAILVAQDGAAISTAALGMADREATAPNTADTAFDIGSIAKTFTAVAVLQLVDEGSLALDDTIGELLADVPPDKRDITVVQLLDFTSGLHEYHDTDGDFEAMTRQEALGRILDQRLLFEPGTDTAYSNSSYTLAAMVVEEVTGRGFTDVVDDLFATAGLQRTGFYGSANLDGIPVATGYEGQTHGANNPASWEPTWALLGSGGIASSVSDLHAWWTRLVGPGLLEAESRERLMQQLSDTLGGMEVRGVGGTNDYGFDAMIIDIPRRRTVIVVASNANPPDRSIASETSLVLTQLVGD